MCVWGRITSNPPAGQGLQVPLTTTSVRPPIQMSSPSEVTWIRPDLPIAVPWRAT